METGDIREATGKSKIINWAKNLKDYLKKFEKIKARNILNIFFFVKFRLITWINFNLIQIYSH